MIRFLLVSVILLFSLVVKPTLGLTTCDLIPMGHAFECLGHGTCNGDTTPASQDGCVSCSGSWEDSWGSGFCILSYPGGIEYQCGRYCDATVGGPGWYVEMFVDSFWHVASFTSSAGEETVVDHLEVLISSKQVADAEMYCILFEGSPTDTVHTPFTSTPPATAGNNWFYFDVPTVSSDTYIHGNGPLVGPTDTPPVIKVGVTYELYCYAWGNTVWIEGRGGGPWDYQTSYSSGSGLATTATAVDPLTRSEFHSTLTLNGENADADFVFYLRPRSCLGTAGDYYPHYHPLVCSGNGSCVADQTPCVCHGNYVQRVDVCDDFKCEDGLWNTGDAGTVCLGPTISTGCVFDDPDCICVNNREDNVGICDDWKCEDGSWKVQSAGSECNSLGTCSETNATCICTLNWESQGAGYCNDYRCEGGNFALSGVPCSGHGSCNPSNDACVCTDNWANEGAGLCNDYKCEDGNWALAGTDECSTHGTCSSISAVCACDDNWEDRAGYCDDYKCADGSWKILSNGSECSGHGTCSPVSAVCACDDNWLNRAGHCDDYTCEDGSWKILSDGSECSTHGTCSPVSDVCACDDNWDDEGGDYCNDYKCQDGNWALAGTSECSGHGTCSPVSPVCACDDNWLNRVAYCDDYKCEDGNWALAGTSECSTHGTCSPVSPVCACDDNWVNRAGYCDDYKCEDGNWALAGTDECSTHGTCSPTSSTCVCWDSWENEGVGFCNDYKCEDGSWKILSNGSECSGVGTCSPTSDVCACRDNWEDRAGDCDDYKCEDGSWKILSGGSECSTHGTCSPISAVCACDDNWDDEGGDYCNDYKCQDGNWALAGAGECSGHGSCTEIDSECMCTPPWDDQGLGYCNDYKCEDGNWKIASGSECSSHGTCSVGSSECVCVDNWDDRSGSFCNDYKCEDGSWKIFASGSECSSHGTCSASDSTCVCTDNWAHQGGSNYCNDYKCVDGNWALLDDSECSGFGTCSSTDVSCVCDRVHVGSLCETNLTCFGVSYHLTDIVCSGHGECIDSIDNCNCHADYGSPSCSVAYCNSILGTNPSVCSDGQGECVSPNNCSCDSNHYGQWCETANSCGGYEYDDPLVCRAHGSCVGVEDCSCEVGYGGDECMAMECFGIPNTEDDVCSSVGICWGLDLCMCQSGHYGRNCAESMPQRVIFVTGESVQTTLSFSLPYVASVDDLPDDERDGPFDCTNRMMPDSIDVIGPSSICEWRLSASGTKTTSVEAKVVDVDCSLLAGIGLKQQERENIQHEILIVPMTTDNFFERVPASVVLQLTYPARVGAIAAGIVVPMLLLLFAAVVVVIVLTVGVILYRKRAQKLDLLDDFDIVLKEQEAAKDRSVPHLNFSSKAFEIDWEELKLIKLIGKGGSDASVFLAKFRDSEVAIKVFKVTAFGEQSFEEFEREVSILSSLLHPSILKFYGATIKNSRVGIVMEYCSNGDMNDFIEAEHLKRGIMYPLKSKLRMLREIGSSLAYVHSRSIVHRDIKPENVLITKAEETRLTDFGLSKVIASESKLLHTQRVGTSFYMSPEVYLGNAYSENCDLFSFGMLCFVILTERTDPYGSEGQAVEAKVAFDPAYRPYINEALEPLERCPWMIPVIAQSWAADPNSRPRASEIVQVISDNLGDVVDVGTQSTEFAHVGEKENPSEAFSVEMSNDQLVQLLGERDRDNSQLRHEVEWLKACLQQAYYYHGGGYQQEQQQQQQAEAEAAATTDPKSSTPKRPEVPPPPTRRVPPPPPPRRSRLRHRAGGDES